MQAHPDQPAAPRYNTAAGAAILALGAISTALYAWAALAGDLRDRPVALWTAHALLCLLGATAWWAVRRRPAILVPALAFAVLFRLVAAAGAPALSDDVYRYVWDGRVQAHGIHPYAYAPDDPTLEALRDANWESINHPELKTIYPPLSQAVFFSLAAVGAGPVGFKLAAGFFDVLVIAALGLLLRSLRLPRDRIVLYAWNPLVVLETAGSGHLEPLGAALVVVAAACIIGRRPGASTLALAAAVHVKLLPALLIPGWIRRLQGRWLLLLAAGLVLPALPYALTGPAVGSGLFDYAERWERNAVAFDVVRGGLELLDSGERLEPVVVTLRERAGGGAWWEVVREWTWPDRLARVVVAVLALCWIAALTFRRGLDAAREAFLAIGGVLLLSPTLHPWYLVWVLPFAAAWRSWPWLLLGALAPLAYVTEGSVPWSWRALEYGPPLLLAACLALARRAGRARSAGTMAS